MANRGNRTVTKTVELTEKRKAVGAHSYKKGLTQFTYPEIRISGTWLLDAGFDSGMRIRITSPKPGELVVRVV